jgi:long-chain fatty acid transport protein
LVIGGLEMSSRRVKALLLACTGIGALCLATVDANAGGLAVREQSAYGQGSSFAGVAAGGDLSSMFWNPATMTQVPGLQMEMVGSGILPYAANSTNSNTFGFTGGTNNVGLSALVPASYASWQINEKMWLGLSVNAPFGLSENFPNRWAGGGYGANSNSLKTYNFAPSFAYRINDWISVGFGLQAQYAQATLGFSYNVLGFIFGTDPQPASLTGAGWGYGYTAGVTLTPTQNLTVGLGYRSGINNKLNGTLVLPAAAGGTPGSINTQVNLPGIASLGLRYRFAPQWTALGTVEWSNWSRIGTSNVLQPNGAPAIAGGSAVNLPFQFSNGWFISAGAEYQWNEKLALRGGVGFERSPVTDAVRMPLIPDNDRTWLSAGATYKFNQKLSFDFAYSHIFVKSTHIDISPTSGNPWYNGLLGTYVGDVSAHVDIVSLALKYRFDDPAPPIKTRLITK